jgi:hypothetical protein
MGPLNRTVIAPLSSAIITVLVAGLVVAGVDKVDRNPVREGTARLDPNGVVEVSVDGAPFVRASHGRTLGAGDRVRVIDGEAVLDLPHSSKVELRGGSAVTVKGAGEPELALDQGDLLVESGRGDTVAVDGGTALVAVAGNSKLRRGVSLAAGVYDGTARMQRNDQGLTIPQYRQAAVVGTGILPQAPEPLSLSASDEWDRRMLGPVLALDEQLTLFARTFEALAPPSPGPDLYKQWLPALAPFPITADLLAGRAAGENLIGLTLVALDNGDFQTRFQRIFGFRAQGAIWGLVAADRAINPTAVLGQLDKVLAGLQQQQAQGPGLVAAPPLRGRGVTFGGGAGPGPTGTGTSGGGPSANGGGAPSGAEPGGNGGTGEPGGGGTGGGGAGGGSGGGSGNPNKKLIDIPPTGTFLDPILNPIVDPVENLLSGILGGLLGQGVPTTGTAPTSSAGSAPTAAPTPTATATATGSASTGSTSGTTAASTGGSTSTGTTTATSSTTTTTSPGLLGGVVGGVTKTLGGTVGGLIG